MERAARRCRRSSRPPTPRASPRAPRSRATTARTFKRLGLNAIWAPSLEVGPEDGGAMGTRAFSDEPGQVAAYAQATVGASTRDARVLAAAGRFPGLGAAAVPPEEAPPNVGLTRRGAAHPRPRPVPRGDPRGRAGDRRRPRPLRDRRLRRAGVAVAARCRRTCCAASSASAGVAIADDLTLPGHHDDDADVPEAAVCARSPPGSTWSTCPARTRTIEETYNALLRAVKRGGIPSGGGSTRR